jgi:hypothetical protein
VDEVTVTVTYNNILHYKPLERSTCKSFRRPLTTAALVIVATFAVDEKSIEANRIKNRKTYFFTEGNFKSRLKNQTIRKQRYTYFELSGLFTSLFKRRF